MLSSVHYWVYLYIEYKNDTSYKYKVNKYTRTMTCTIIKKPFILSFLKHETPQFYDIEFYLPRIDDEKVDFTHVISQKDRLLHISFKFPDVKYVPYGCESLETFADSEMIIPFDSNICAASEIIIKECNGDGNLIIIRVLKA